MDVSGFPFEGLTRPAAPSCHHRVPGAPKRSKQKEAAERQTSSVPGFRQKPIVGQEASALCLLKVGITNGPSLMCCCVCFFCFVLLSIFYEME